MNKKKIAIDYNNRAKIVFQNFQWRQIQISDTLKLWIKFYRIILYIFFTLLFHNV